MESVLVTGGAGFIGSHTVERLLANGDSVTVLDDFSTGSMKNIEAIADRIKIVTGDINDPDKLSEAMNGVSRVIHLAAQISVQGSVDDPFTNHLINSTGTLNVLNHATQSGVKRVVFASSSAVYGDSTQGAVDENSPMAPLSPYGASKVHGEAYCSAFSRSYGLETAVLRFYNVYGPRQAPDSDYAAVIPKFISQMITDSRPTIFGDGLQTRDFIYVGDIAEGLVMAMTADGAETGPSNLASDTAVNLLKLIDLINTRFDTDIKPIHVDARPSDVKHSSASVARASSWGFRAKTPLQAGLSETANYLAATAR
jgi:UDP-glucose 4-epimerase